MGLFIFFVVLIVLLGIEDMYPGVLKIAIPVIIFIIVGVICSYFIYKAVVRNQEKKRELIEKERLENKRKQETENFRVAILNNSLTKKIVSDISDEVCRQMSGIISNPIDKPHIDRLGVKVECNCYHNSFNFKISSIPYNEIISYRGENYNFNEHRVPDIDDFEFRKIFVSTVQNLVEENLDSFICKNGVSVGWTENGKGFTVKNRNYRSMGQW